MLRLMTVMLGLALATPVAAADWTYEGGSVPIAYSDNGAAQFEFACRGGDLTLGYYVRSPGKPVKGAGAMNLGLATDGGKPSFAQDMPLIHSGGAWMVVRGPVARQWAGLAQRAKAKLAVSFVQKNAKGGFDFYDSNDFGAGGSSSAIRRVLERCG